MGSTQTNCGPCWLVRGIMALTQICLPDIDAATIFALRLLCCLEIWWLCRGILMHRSFCHLSGIILIRWQFCVALHYPAESVRKHYTDPGQLQATRLPPKRCLWGGAVKTPPTWIFACWHNVFMTNAFQCSIILVSLAVRSWTRHSPLLLSPLCFRLSGLVHSEMCVCTQLLPWAAFCVRWTIVWPFSTGFHHQQVVFANRASHWQDVVFVYCRILGYRNPGRQTVHWMKPVFLHLPRTTTKS